MPEKETTYIEEDTNKEKLQNNFLNFLSEGEVHEARKIIRQAEAEGLELDLNDEIYQDGAQKAVEDSFRKGHVRHAERLLGFATEIKITVDLSGDEMKIALSEGFESCGPQKKEEILEFAKQNQINIET